MHLSTLVCDVALGERFNFETRQVFSIISH